MSRYTTTKIAVRVGRFRYLYAVRVVQWPPRALLRWLVPHLRRDPRLLAFGGNFARFADNPAYLFLHMNTRPELRCVWVSGSDETVDRLQRLGYESVKRWSVAGMRVALRASWYVVSHSKADVNTLLSDGAVIFNLWHGVGVKEVGRSVEGYWKQPVYEAAEGSLIAHLFADDRRPPDWFLSTTPAVSAVNSASFAVPLERCVEIGYPRIDHLVSRTPPPAAFLDQELWNEIERGGTIVGYFPTFRDSTLEIPGGAPVIHELAKIVADQGGTLLFKPHDQSVVKDLDASAAIILPRHADLNAYLGLCDVLITDYSSVANDFLVLNRPIVHFVPDLDDFRAKRGFSFDPFEMLPGLITRTAAELYAALSDLSRLAPPPSRDRIAAHFWGDSARPGACARVADFIQDHLPSGGDAPLAGIRASAVHA